MRNSLLSPIKSIPFGAIFFLYPLSIIATADWYQGKLEGWYYFEETSSDAKHPKGLEPEEAQELLDLEKKQLEEALALAVLEPTPEHLDEYIASHDRLKLRSERFAEQWTQRLEPEEKDRAFLLFCFLGSDPRSKTAAQQSLLLAKEHGLPLKSLSLDGQPTLGVDTFEVNKGLFEKLPFQSVPSLFLIDVFTHEATPINLNVKDFAP